MEENCDVRGYSQTRSHNKEVTDSAAGGTALACGVRTNNSCVAVFHNDKNGLISVPRTLAEAALLTGRRSGVITTDTNGCRETVTDGKTGYLVPVGDADLLAQRMKAFLQKPELAEQMGRESLALCKEKFEVGRVNAEMLKILNI